MNRSASTANMDVPDRPDHLDRLDATVAFREGHAVEAFDPAGLPLWPDGSRYSPTRDPVEALRLMDKHVRRLLRLANSWMAIGRNGRAEEGDTVLIATCKVVASQGASVSP